MNLQYIENTDHIVDTIVEADSIIFEYDADSQFLYNEYDINFTTGETLINLGFCICKFKTVKAAVQAYTSNKVIDELTVFEKQLLVTYIPILSDILEV